MANNNLRVGVSVDTEGYTQGMQEAAKTTESFVQTVQEVVKETPPLRKALRDSRKEADALAYAYNQLSEEEKQSKLGQEIRAQFDIAAQKTADLIDLTGDLGERYKNLASDTRWFDTTIDGFELVANSVLGAVGAIGAFTGNEEDAQRAMSALAATTGVLGAAQKVQQMVQKQSNVMLAIGTIQAKAKAAADQLAAKSTGELTIAQRLFNAVAKANPYVLLATAIIAVVGALGTYLALTRQSKDEEEKAKRAEEQRKAGVDAMASSLENTIPLYTQLQTEWKNLKTEAEQTQWIKDNQEKFHSLGVEITSAGDAENFLVTNTQAVKQAFLARAQAAAAAAEAAEIYKQEMEAINDVESGKRVSMKQALDMGLSREDVIKNSKYHHGWFGKDTYELTAEQITQAREKAIDKAQKRIGKLYDDMTDKEKAAADKMADAGVKAYQAAEAKKQKALARTNKETVKYAIGSLAELEAKLNKLQNDRKNGIGIQLDKEAYLKQVEDLQKQIKDKKIELGFEKPDTKIQKLRLDLEKAKLDYEIALTLNDEDAKNKAKDTYKSIEKEIETLTKQERIDLGIELPDSELTKIKKKIAELEANIEYINDPVALTAAQEEIKQWKKKQEQEEIRLGYVVKPTVGSMDWFNEIVDKMQTELDSTPLVINGEINPEYIKKLKEIRDIQKQVEEAQKTPEEIQAEQIEKKADAYGSYAEMLSSTANALGALGDSEAAQAAQFAMNSASMIASAIQKIAAMQAAAIAEGTESGAGLPFPANLAAIATIVSTIMSIFASLPKFTEGGIMGGHSYYGDKLLARLNSKEVVINEKQQERALDLMDNSSIYNPKQKIEVVGVVRGTDVVLVAKNVIKEMKKNGKNIKIG